MSIEPDDFDGRLTDWPIDSTFMTELGRIASPWAVTEELLNIGLARFTGFEISDPRRFVLFEHISANAKAQALETLFRLEHGNELGPSLQDAIRQLNIAKGSRNRFMHNPLVMDEDSGQYVVTQASARGNLKLSVSTVDLRTLREVAIQIHSANQALSVALFGSEVPPEIDDDNA